jgi:glyoxylase-like metal-dependent hydrolase (beta-lactamase superfamily II)
VTGEGSRRSGPGGYRISAAVLTRFRLDGGAMFGSVPKPLWERHEPGDDRNRIALAARVLYLEGGGRKILVDAGLGDKFGAREAEMFAVEPAPGGDLPFRWEELTDIVLTHLHFDHAGGISRRTAEGLVLSAPQARVHLQRRNWERALAPGARERASYLAENVEPLRGADLRLLDGGGEVLPGIRVEVSNGHTAGMQWLLVGEGRGAVAFPADLIPTSSHVHLPFVMGYDLCVETLLGEKEDFLARAVAGEWTVVFEHDARLAAARLTRGKEGRYAVGEKVEV